MSVLLTTLLSALLPVGVEGLKQVITTKMGGVKPTTIEEQLQIDILKIKNYKPWLLLIIREVLLVSGY